jgi:hypothetical protein
MHKPLWIEWLISAYGVCDFIIVLNWFKSGSDRCWKISCWQSLLRRQPIRCSCRAHWSSIRWLKYDRDDLCVNKSLFVPVIFQPPCIKMSSTCLWRESGSFKKSINMRTNYAVKYFSCVQDVVARLEREKNSQFVVCSWLWMQLVGVGFAIMSCTLYRVFCLLINRA